MDVVVWRKKIMNPKSVVYELSRIGSILMLPVGMLDFTVNNFCPLETYTRILPEFSEFCLE